MIQRYIVHTVVKLLYVRCRNALLHWLVEHLTYINFYAAKNIQTAQLASKYRQLAICLTPLLVFLLSLCGR
jgi:hypothetical protein